MKLFAVSAKGLEEITSKEIEAIGGKKIKPIVGGVQFEGTLETLYRANLYLRTATRIYRELDHFPVKDADTLLRGVTRMGWEQYFHVEQTFAVSATVSQEMKSENTHTHFLSLKVKDGICDRFRETTGRRPSVHPSDPDVWVHLHLGRGGFATLSLDSSGKSLHERGYRERGVHAPLKETLAAGIVMLTGWNGSVPFLDPMCGSGTLVIEAALIALNIAPGLLRKEYAFTRWPDFDSKLWDKLRKEAESACKTKLDHPVVGWDRDREAVAASWSNARRAGLEKFVHFEKRDWYQLDVSSFEQPGVMLTNPPWGERLGSEEELREFYGALGDGMKQKLPGWTGFLFVGNPELLKLVGLRPSRRIALFHGPIECRLLRYDLYAGKKGAKSPAPEEPASDSSDSEK